MTKYSKTLAIAAVATMGVLALQGCSDMSTVASKDKKADITVAYKAIVNSKEQQQTIAKLVADGKNADMVASVATVAGVSQATIQAALPAMPDSELIADVAAAQNDPAAYSPSAAAGVSTSSPSQYKGPHSLRSSF